MSLGTFDSEKCLYIIRKAAVPRLQTMPNFDHLIFQLDGAHLFMQYLFLNFWMQRHLGSGLRSVGFDSVTIILQRHHEWYSSNESQRIFVNCASSLLSMRLVRTAIHPGSAHLCAVAWRTDFNSASKCKKDIYEHSAISKLIVKIGNKLNQVVNMVILC